MMQAFFDNSCTVFIISSSFFLSNELVLSSKIKISLSLYNDLAIPILCFWPPEKFLP